MVRLALELHPQKIPELWVHRNVEISILQIDGEGLHFWKEYSSDGLQFEMVWFQELVEVKDWMRSSWLLQQDPKDPTEEARARKRRELGPLESRKSTCSWRILILVGSVEDMNTGVREERGRDLSNSS